MKIIDFEIKGNQIKFYVGTDNCENYWGDDWDDRPYEHNAGKVYNEFIVGWFVKTFEFDDLVMEASEGPWCGNSPYSKEDMKKREVPCVCVLQKEFQDEYIWSYDFCRLLANENAIKYYFGDIIDETKEDIHYIKDIKAERKYLAIAFESDKKTQKMIANILGETLSSYASDIYKSKYDNDCYEKISTLTIHEYKKYIKSLISSISELCQLKEIDKLPLKMAFTSNKNIKLDNMTTTTICIQSPMSFEIGVVKQNA